MTVTFVSVLAAWLGLALLPGLRAQETNGFPSRAQFERADAETVRLEPAVFPDLPSGIRADLERRQCRVPQPFGSKTSQGVVRGRFTSTTGPTDTAVLCSRLSESVILVYRSGRTDRVDELSRRLDRDFLQVVNPGEIGYSRALAAIRSTDLQARRSRLGPETPGTIDLDGIDDAFVEKGSTIFYWDGRRWLQLQGSD